MCEPMTITMMVVAVAMAVKTSMDAKKNAALQRKNAIAQQKIEQEQLLKRKAEQGDADAMAAFEKSRASRVEAARITAAGGEQGASSTNNFQVNNMLQGLGFGTGLQTTADARSADARLANSDMMIKASGVNFTNRMRTINASDPSGLTTIMNATAAGANAASGDKTIFGGGTGGGAGVSTRARNNGMLNPDGGI